MSWSGRFQFIDDADRLWHRLWSMRLALFFGALSGLVAVWAAFQDVMPLWAFAGTSVLMNVAIAVARVTKQPGVDE